MNFISNLLGWLFGWPMWGIYHVVHHYGISIIVFTILMKSLLSLFQIHAIKNRGIDRYVKQRVSEIKKEYVHDGKKMEEEILKVYTEHKTSPLSRIIPLFIQIPMLYGLLNVFYNPLKHILRLPKETIATLTKTAQEALGSGFHPSTSHLSIIEAVVKKPEAFQGMDVAEIANFNMDFLGINLCDTPIFGVNLTMLFPILVLLTSLAPIVLTTIKRIRNKAPIKQIVVSPVISLFFGSLLVLFSLTMPVAMSLYWVVSSLVAQVISFVLEKTVKEKPVILNPKPKDATEKGE